MFIMLYKLYAKVNSTLYDFRNVPCHVKAKLLSTYCLDLYMAHNYGPIGYRSIDVQFLVFFSLRKKNTICCHSRCLSVRPSVVCGNNFGTLF